MLEKLTYIKIVCSWVAAAFFLFVVVVAERNCLMSCYVEEICIFTCAHTYLQLEKNMLGERAVFRNFFE